MACSSLSLTQTGPITFKSKACHLRSEIRNVHYIATQKQNRSIKHIPKCFGHVLHRIFPKTLIVSEFQPNHFFGLSRAHHLRRSTRPTQRALPSPNIPNSTTPDLAAPITVRILSSDDATMTSCSKMRSRCVEHPIHESVGQPTSVALKEIRIGRGRHHLSRVSTQTCADLNRVSR